MWQRIFVSIVATGVLVAGIACNSITGVIAGAPLGDGEDGEGGAPGEAPAGGGGTGGVAGGATSGAGGGGGSGAQCRPGEERECYSGPPGTPGVGPCTIGHQVCYGDGSSWGPCEGELAPADEICNGVDDDCDGTVDEALSQICYSGPQETQDFWPCHGGVQVCSNGVWGICEGEVTPTPEECNAVDDNCNGLVDEALSRDCYAGPPGTQGVGVCHGGTQSCSNGGWSTCTGAVTPSPESCNAVDDDCDGQVDEGMNGASCSTGIPGICSQGTRVCTGSELLCEPVNEPSGEIGCNGLDDDCDGEVDECFAAGTTIAMADGTMRAIEAVTVGEWVLSYDMSAGQVIPARVTRTFMHQSSANVVRINGSLRATGNHPFYANGRWTRADELAVGDRILVLDPSGSPMMASVDAVSALLAEPDRMTTYNLEVEGHHNYFAGGVLVHNKQYCPLPLPAR